MRKGHHHYVTFRFTIDFGYTYLKVNNLVIFLTWISIFECYGVECTNMDTKKGLC